MKPNPIVVERLEQRDPNTVIKKHYYWCPGCDALHGIAIRPDVQSNGASWTFTGTLDRPTYEPSQLFALKGPPRKVCHTFIRNGLIEFLTDSTHAMAGRTVPLPPLPDWFVSLDDDVD
jgi:hypothetical protein